jgi:hypothetical protein
MFSAAKCVGRRKVLCAFLLTSSCLPSPGGRVLPPMGFYRFRLPPASRLQGEGEGDSRDFGAVGSGSGPQKGGSEHNQRSSLQSRHEPVAGDPFQRPAPVRSVLREVIQTPLDPTGGASPLGFPSGY